MSSSCIIEHLHSRPKFEMEVDEHIVNGNKQVVNSIPSIITLTNDVQSNILQIDTDNNTVNVVTIKEPRLEIYKHNGSVLHSSGSSNSDIQSSLRSDHLQPSLSVIPGNMKRNERTAALTEKKVHPINESIDNTTSESDSDTDSDTASQSSKSTFNSSAVGDFHACTAPGCGKKFSRPSRLQQHLRIHSGERPYVCPVADCGRSYTRSQHLHRHTQITHKTNTTNQSQHPLPDKNSRCDQCDKRFASVYSLRKHVSQYHERRKYSCTECGQVFLKQQHLRTHSQSHSNAPAFSCDAPGCTASFFLPSKLQRHKLQHVPGRYKCTRDPNCKQVFDRHVDLRRHLASQHPFVCSVCGVEFAEQSRYNRHKTTHEDLRLTYHCTKPGCGRCYYTLRALTSHVRDSHEQRTSHHECVVCTKRFATKQKLQQHLKTHGPGCGRVVKKVTGKKRKTRCDKGIGRTDYRSLLAGLPPGIQLNENVDNEVLGTRRLLEGSAIARYELSKVRTSNDSTAIKRNIKEDNVKKARPTCETGSHHPTVSTMKLSEVNAHCSDKTDSYNVHEEKTAKDKEILHECNSSAGSESEKVGSVYISGHGAIKQSSVLLARLSDKMVDMLDDCKLAGSGK